MQPFFRRVWRWHFWAGLLACPILIVVAGTGALYTFKDEIEDWRQSEERFVAVGAERVPLSVQVTAATGWLASAEPAQVTLPGDDDRATVVQVSTPAGPRAVHVDPYTGTVLGDTPARSDFFTTVLALHRRLLAGTTGRILVELATCWTVVLVVSGVYLWMPRTWRRVWGVWLPRVRSKPYVVLRDLHSLAGLFLAPVLVLLAVTGLFFSVVWLASLNAVTDGAGVFPRHFLAGPPSSPGAVTAVALDGVEPAVRPSYPTNPLVVIVPAAVTDPLLVRVRGRCGPSYVGSVALDRTTGTVLARKEFDADLAWHEKVRMWVLPLHMGSVYGWPTKAVAFAACLGLVWLSVSGVWMWLARRPAGRTGFPRASAAPVPKPAVLLILLLAVLFPIVGLSLIVVLLGEWGFERLRPRPATSSTPQTSEVPS